MFVKAIKRGVATIAYQCLHTVTLLPRKIFRKLRLKFDPKIENYFDSRSCRKAKRANFERPIETESVKGVKNLTNKI